VEHNSNINPRCDWTLLCGVSHLQKHGIDGVMFAQFARWSPFDHNGVVSTDASPPSCCTCGNRDDANCSHQHRSEDPSRSNTLKQKIAYIGIRLVNEARLLFLQSHGWRPRLVRYVPESITPCNILIIAHRSHKPQPDTSGTLSSSFR
jgi:hypothetical protein